MRRHRPALLSLSLALSAQSAALVAQAAPDDTKEAAPAGASGAAEEAASRYRKGRELYERKAWDQALAEFIASRKLHSTWKATSGAALSLKQLGRYDEALELFEALLRELGGEIPPEAKGEVQRQVVELRGLVATIEVEGAEPGAVVNVDGQARGEYPLLVPLRVPSGSHLVRVTKEGFEPFEKRIDVAGGRTERVTTRLRPLLRSGRLRVAEQGGRALDVVVDGGVVGKTPWEGLLAPGEHVIALRGEGNLGTPPLPVSVVVDRTTPLTLAAEELQSMLRVVPVPANASVGIDGVTVGRGHWEGRLRRGAHTVEVTATGFLGHAQRVSLALGEQRAVEVLLQRDPNSPMWRKPARFFLEAGGALLLSPTFGGDVASCSAPCAKGPGLGGKAAVRGGYALGSGLAFGVAVGFVGLAQSVTGRTATLLPVGRTARPATVTDALGLGGVSVEGWTGVSLGERVPVHVKLGAGVVFGAVSDRRSGTFVATDGKRYDLRPVQLAPTATLFWVSPEVRVGLRLGRDVELLLGVDVSVLAALSRPQWDVRREIDAATDGIGVFGAETLSGTVMVAMGPSAGVRYSF